MVRVEKQLIILFIISQLTILRFLIIRFEFFFVLYVSLSLFCVFCITLCKVSPHVPYILKSNPH